MGVVGFKCAGIFLGSDGRMEFVNDHAGVLGAKCGHRTS